jgi:flagellar biosynthesis/type III secretory pathway M-ring protein FliF/YscJ
MPLFGKKPVKPTKPVQPIEPVKRKRTQAELSAEAARWAARLNQSTAQPATPREQVTKEDKIREIMQNDPEKAAALIREMFLKGK